MITQIEIDGFKSFKDFKLELAPFQVIVGPNGSGKSNLFDALQLLSRAVDIRPDADLYSMLLELRGGEDELFMKLPDGKTSDHIRLAIEMLIDRRTLMSTRHIYAPYMRLRYELKIIQASHKEAPDQLYVAHESLSVIPPQEDSWCKKHKIDASLVDQSAASPEKTIVLFSLSQKEDKAELVAYKHYVKQNNLIENKHPFQ
jgi:energy-coupling factor transporter ATP-binding protein EcfA2